MTTACGGFHSTQGLSSGDTQHVVKNPFGHPFRLGVLGDSISRGFDIDHTAQESVTKNWASGTALSDSHLNKFLAMFNQAGWTVPMEPHNLAVVGNTVLGSTSTLLTNAAGLAAAAPDYVTIEIGANDVCQGLLAPSGAAANFQSKITSVLSALLAANPPPRLISVASIPHIWALTQIPQLAQVQGCQQFWSLVCPNLSVGQSTFDAQWTAANTALKNAVTAAGATVTYDQGAVAATSFDVNDVSALDCFHPSEIGQGKISEAVWANAVAPLLSSILPQQ